MHTGRLVLANPMLWERSCGVDSVMGVYELRERYEVKIVVIVADSGMEAL